jgi:GTP-binding protein HflX
MLFATLDPTMRRVALPHGGPEVILSDTVGFISDLPTELVAAFRATLEEVLEADLICHVRDISHPETEAQARDVATILENLGVRDTTPQIEVWNKIDRLDEEARRAALTQAARLEEVQAVSAVTGQRVETLVSAISQALSALRHVSTLHLGFDEGRKRAWLYEKDLVEDERQTEDGFVMTVQWSARQEEQFRDV